MDSPRNLRGIKCQSCLDPGMPREAEARMQDTTIAVDLAKSVFEVAISHTPGKVSKRHRFTRRRFAGFLAEAAPAVIVMEASSSAHYWAREAEARGHTVRLLPAQDVARRLRGNKTDRNDAKAMLEAHRDEEVHAVPVKTLDQQAMLGLREVLHGPEQQSAPERGRRYVCSPQRAHEIGKGDAGRRVAETTLTRLPTN